MGGKCLGVRGGGGGLFHEKLNFVSKSTLSENSTDKKLPMIFMEIHSYIYVCYMLVCIISPATYSTVEKKKRQTDQIYL